MKAMSVTLTTTAPSYQPPPVPHLPDSQAAILPFTIIIDNREKTPYSFSGFKTDANQSNKELIVPIKRAYLPTGDYSIEGLEDVVTIERKTKADLFSTLGGNLERFRREIIRMTSYAYAAVVIESTWESIINEPPAYSRFPVKSVFRAACRWTVRYQVPMLAIDNRRIAEAWVLRSLQEFWEGHSSKSKAKKKDAKPKMITIPMPRENSDVKEAVEIYNDMQRIAEEIQAPDGIDFAVDVCESAAQVIATIERNNHVTKAQFNALNNWQYGIERWLN